MEKLLDPAFLVETLGLIGVIGMIFAESGLFFGFFLPGDSLLLTAGLLASQAIINFPLLLIGSVLAAIIGDNVGYAFGRAVGPKIFNREDSVFFHKRHIERTKIFYDRYGKKTIIMARFVPIVRTFAPILAGVGGMEYCQFLIYNIVGGALWVCLLSSLGYFIGRTIPNADSYILPLALAIILLSFIPLIIDFIKHKAKH
jgi:membrane-associated protein